MRQAPMMGSPTVYYLHTDHLGSTSEVTKSNGGLQVRLRYLPFGKVRYTFGLGGVPAPASISPGSPALALVANVDRAAVARILLSYQGILSTD